jgi:hypothetical protein
VQVSAQVLASEGVLIEVNDWGVGISESRLEEMNWRLDNPPVMDVSVSRHMGLFAVGRLAQRHGVRVRLRLGAPNGLTALLWLPESVIERGKSADAWGQPAVGQPAVGQRARALAGRRGLTAQSEANVVPDGSTQAMPGGASAQARGTGAVRSRWFRNQGAADGGRRQAADKPAGMSASRFAGASGPAGTSDGSGTSSGDRWAEAAQIVSEPNGGDQTAAGLPLRVPRANLIPGSTQDGVDSTGRDSTGRDSTSGGHGTADGSAVANRAVGGGRIGGQPMTSQQDSYPGQPPAASRPRTPDMARSRLSGFQRGTRRAQDQRPAGEGADR